jgi:hypothetical protein
MLKPRIRCDNVCVLVWALDSLALNGISGPQSMETEFVEFVRVDSEGIGRRQHSTNAAVGVSTGAAQMISVEPVIGEGWLRLCEEMGGGSGGQKGSKWCSVVQLNKFTLALLARQSLRSTEYGVQRTGELAGARLAACGCLQCLGRRWEGREGGHAHADAGGFSLNSPIIAALCRSMHVLSETGVNGSLFIGPA